MDKPLKHFFTAPAAWHRPMQMAASIARSPDQPRLASRLADAVALLLIALAVLATRAIWFGDPVADYDEQLYSFIGGRMLQGELPYVDWWDRKPFGLFALYALAHAAFGPEAMAYQLLAALFALAAGIIIYLLARRLADRMAAVLAAIYGVLMLALYSSHSGQSEVFLAPLLLGMVWLLSRPDQPRSASRADWAMVLGGMALQVKYTVLPACVALGLWALWQHRTTATSWAALLLRALFLAALGLLPTLLVACFYALIGQFDSFAHANFFSFFERLPAPQGRWSASHWIGTAPLALAAIGGAYAALRVSPVRDPALYRLLLVWSLATLAGVLLPGTVYLYYYAILAAPAALLAVPLFDRASPLRGFPGLLLLVGCVALFAPLSRVSESQAERVAASQLANAIAPHVSPTGPCLWLHDGPVALYRMSGSCVPTRLVYPDHLNNALETRALGVDQTAEVARILSTRPAAIVTASRAVTVQNQGVTALVQGELARHYAVAASAPMHGRTLTVWLRRDREPGPFPAATATNRHTR